MVESTGTNVNLSKGPKSMDRSQFAGGKIEEGFGPVSVPMKGVTPLQYKMGKMDQECTATYVDLGTSPQKGWNSAPTPMSNRAIQQSKTGGK